LTPRGIDSASEGKSCHTSQNCHRTGRKPAPSMPRPWQRLHPTHLLLTLARRDKAEVRGFGSFHRTRLRAVSPSQIYRSSAPVLLAQATQAPPTCACRQRLQSHTRHTAVPAAIKHKHHRGLHAKVQRLGLISRAEQPKSIARRHDSH